MNVACIFHIDRHEIKLNFLLIKLYKYICKKKTLYSILELIILQSK